MKNYARTGVEYGRPRWMCSLQCSLKFFGFFILSNSAWLCIISLTLAILSSETSFTSAFAVCGFCLIIEGTLCLYGSTDVRRHYRAITACEVLGLTNLVMVVICFLSNLNAWQTHIDNCTTCNLGLNDVNESDYKCSWFCDWNYNIFHAFMNVWLGILGFVSVSVSFIIWLNICQ